MSGRLPVEPAQIVILGAACAVLALMSGSCSRAVKMSVAGPADLVAAPAGGRDSHAPRVTRRDSVATRDDGLLVFGGDSILVYSRVEPSSSLHVPQPGDYRLERSAHRVRVVGFVPVGGRVRAWEGTMSVRGDSLEFLAPKVPRHGFLGPGTPAETLRVATRSIERVDLEQTDVVETAVTITLVTAVLAAVAIVTALTALNTY
jgi:hypothetical protein